MDDPLNLRRFVNAQGPVWNAVCAESAEGISVTMI